MSEFKGTKCKWEVDYSTTSNLVYKYQVSLNQETDLVAQANALLISKAPEMLEMLERFVHHNMLSIQGEEEAIQLIKSATEL